MILKFIFLKLLNKIIIIMISYFRNLFYYDYNINKYSNVLEFLPNYEKISNMYFNNEELIDVIKKFCIYEESNKFIISLSGGVDSMVLISIIKNLGYEVVGIHINYNNRFETSLEEEFLKYWCSKNDICLYIKNIESIKRINTKRSEYEIITKNIRFDFYKEILKKENSNIILLAHHKDDIVENIFANVCRGRNILDLAVIKEKTTIDGVNIGRPMINIYKKFIYDFAKKYKIPYFKDSTPNWSVRGKYRNLIYPIIEDTFTKNVKDNLLSLSRQSHEWNNLINEKIIGPFMDTIIWNNEPGKLGVSFDITNYRNHPLCFWNIVFANIFYHFDKNCPSRKGIQTFMNVIKENSVCFASVSNNCICYIKNNSVKITFKYF